MQHSVFLTCNILQKVLAKNNWAEKVTGWSAVNIYEWTLVKGELKTLDQKRREKMAEFEE